MALDSPCFDPWAVSVQTSVIEERNSMFSDGCYFHSELPHFQI